MEIDGFLNLDEWQDSKIINMSEDNTLYLCQSEEFLFIGIKHNEEIRRYVDLYLENDAIGTINLHASMQLGERNLTGQWSDTAPGWNRGNNTDWNANTVSFTSGSLQGSFLESLKDYQGHEFQISKKRLIKNQFKLRIEVRDFDGEAEDIQFPSTSTRVESTGWFDIDLG